MAQDSPQQREAERLIEQALDLSPAEREALLDQHCAGNPELRRQVEQALLAHDRSEEYLNNLRQDLGITHPDEALELAGQVIDNYRLQRLLGEGGMGAVYLAERTAPYHQLVALKLLSSGRWLRRWHERFLRERQMLASLKHPHICRLLDGGVNETGVPYLVMEWIDGEPIDVYCAKRELDPAAIIQLFLKLASAVAYAHGQGIIHRDLKPANVLVAEGDDLQVVDFGIARMLDEGTTRDTADPITGQGTQPLTPAYASPEQLRAEKASVASDVYALGVLLYQLLSGRLPFDVSGQSPAGIERLVSDTEPPKLSRAAAPEYRSHEIQPDLDAVVARMIHHDVHHRYRTVEDAAADLQNVLAHRPVSARSPTVWYRVSRFVRRHRFPVAAGTVAALSLTAAAILGLSLAVAAREQARLLAEERDRAQAATGFLVDLFASLNPNTNPLDTTARDLLEQGAQRIEGIDSPALQREMLDTVSGVYRILREFPKARDLLEQELTLAAHLDDPVISADVLARLAGTQLAMGEYDDALDSVDQSLALLGEREAGEIRAGALLVRGQTLHRRGETALARATYESALPLARRFPGKDEEQLSILQSEMANLANHVGEEEEAVVLFEEVLARRILRHGEYSSPVSSTLLGLAQTRRSQGAITEAIELLERANQINQHLFGPDNDRHAFVFNSLGRAYESYGDFEASEQYYREALRLVRLFRGPEHPNVGFGLGNVAKILSKQEQWADAASFFEQAVAITEANRPDHIAVHDMRWNWGKALMKSGALAEAEEPIIKGLNSLAANYGDQHPSTRGALEAAVELYSKLGEQESADRYQQRLSAIQQN
ncbi:MAG: tetratricopeptide repeat protein [Pseudomonadota bacterium]